MKLLWTELLFGVSIGGVNAVTNFMAEATNSERMSGYGPVDKPSWEPEFFDESRPYQGIRIARQDWTLECSSDDKQYPCQNAIDGSNKTSWRSLSDSKGHSIIVDLGKPYAVSGLVVLPPIDTGNDGLITQHKIYYSNNKEDWIGPIAYGMWPDTNRQRLSAFEPTSARYVKLNAISEAGVSSWIGISELNIYATLYTIPQDPKFGLWGATLDFPIVPVAGAQEASGNIVLWSSWASDQFHSTPGGQTAMTRWNPLNNEVSKRIVTDTSHDMFCPGIAIDGTGMMVVTGGNDASQTSLYDSSSDQWTKGPEMALRRGYHASTTLSDGRVFIIGGSWAGGSNIAKDGEIYDPIVGNWSLLPGATVKEMLTDDMEGAWRADNHGWLFGWQNGSVFQAGPSQAMNWYFTDGNGSVQAAGDRLDDEDSMSGNAVMFDATEGKILTLGGAPDYDKAYATNNAHVITLKGPGEKPDVIPAGINGKMHSERVFHTSVVLPDGTVFVTGGQTYGVAFNEENVQLVPELYDPATNTFTELSGNNVVRVYHTLSILLPDGRILNAGGGLCGNCSANHYDGQIFTPPYLLTEEGELRSRPEITSLLPARLNVGEVLEFTTGNAIRSASLVRLSSATHTVNTDQRRVPLPLSKIPLYGNRYLAYTPADSGILIPGYWMLFVIDANGTPSIAQTIFITTPKTLDSSDETESKLGLLESYWQTWRPTLIAQFSRPGRELI
ncbi:galactose oxidase precursor [Sclerotinia borealis F-4128]|uniref:Galactose oxidase n=1 Tax=Sclerotinia borealis (strain F-4128) TaxID=1432307 RepID=W9C9A9_SCLBF|nr:galactose oxidase precursor [Sclerotinia borealis F-4128]